MSLLTRLSLRNRVVVALLSLIVLAAGVFATTSIKQELFPSLDLPGGAVVTSYPGAAPDLVERTVTEPVEDAVKGVSGVTKVSSTTMSGVSQVQVEWDFNADDEQIRSDIDAALNTIQPNLPQDVDPKLTAGNLDEIPILALAVSSDEPQAQLSEKLEDIAVPRLSGIEGVRSVSVSGVQKQQVVVTFNPARVKEQGVQPAQLAEVLKANGTPVPAGDLPVSGRAYDIEVGDTLDGPQAVGNLRLQGTDGPVVLSQVATVKQAPAEQTSISRTNGEPTLGLAVVKETDGNTVSVSHDVRDALPGLQQQLGGNAAFVTVFDQAPYIEQSLHDLTNEGALGLLFAVLVIFAFLLSPGPTIIAAISIPMSLLIAILGLWLDDQTLNIFTLGALTVAIGRVVDDSIVVIENIKRHLGRGERGTEAVVGAVREVAAAVTASTITTVAVFLPLGLVSGQVGELFRPFAVTVTIALLASLLVALTLVPVLAYWFMRPSRRGVKPKVAARREARAEASFERQEARRGAREEKSLQRFLDARKKLVTRLERKDASPATIDAAIIKLRRKHEARLERAGHHVSGHHDPEHLEAETGLQRGYLPVLRWSLAHRALTIVLALVILVGTFALTPLLKTDFLGDAGQNSLRITQKMPPGTALSATDAASRRVEAVVRAEPAVQTVATTVGSAGAEQAAFGGVGGSDQATFDVMLHEGQNGQEVAGHLRVNLAKLGTAAGEVEVQSSDGGAGSDQVAVEVTGHDRQALKQGSDQVVALMSRTPGVTQVTSDLAENRRMLKVDVDPAKAANYGMTQADIGQAVTAAVSGTPSGEVVVGDTTQEVLVRSRTPVQTLAQMRAIELPVTEKQTADARKRAGDQVQQRQDQAEADQRQQAQEQAAQQVTELERGRDEARRQVDRLEQQIAALQSSPGAPTGPGAPGPGAAQAAQLQQALEQARDQSARMDEQISTAREQQTQADQQAQEARQLADAAKAAQEVEGSPAKLSEVATVRTVAAPATITRVDGARAVTVSGTPTGGDLSATTAALQQGLASEQLPPGVTASIGGVSQEQEDAFRQLGLAMLIAIALVFLVMVATFRSLLQPFILLVSVPFAATGAIGLLLLTNTPLGLPAMIGLLMLIGIVVTNAIVLIDLVNQYREGGASVDEAVVHGARLRLRPILMTALATIGALIPMSLGITGGGVFISRPLAIVVIGGLVSSTLLTLVLVPVLYDLLERGRERVRRRRRHRRGDDAPVDGGDEGGPEGRDGLGGPGGPDEPGPEPTDRGPGGTRALPRPDEGGEPPRGRYDGPAGLPGTP